MSKMKVAVFLVIGFVVLLAALDEYRRRLPPPPAPPSAPGQSQTPAPERPGAAAPQDSALATYEDARIRFKHPKDWRVTPISSVASGAKVWLVSGPAKKSPHFGDVVISAPRPTKELVLLEEVYERAHAPDAKIVGTPRRVQLRNSECIIYALEKPLPKSARSQMLTHCYDPDKNLVILTADLDEHPAGEPSAHSQQNRETYERILTSIEFR